MRPLGTVEEYGASIREQMRQRHERAAERERQADNVVFEIDPNDCVFCNRPAMPGEVRCEDHVLRSS